MLVQVLGTLWSAFRRVELKQELVRGLPELVFKLVAFAPEGSSYAVLLEHVGLFQGLTLSNQITRWVFSFGCWSAVTAADFSLRLPGSG